METWLNTPAGRVCLQDPRCTDSIYEWCWHAVCTYGPTNGHDMHLSHEIVEASYDLPTTGRRMGAMAFGAAQAVLCARLPWPVMAKCGGLNAVVARLGARIIQHATPDGRPMAEDVLPLVRAGGASLSEAAFERRKLAEEGSWYDASDYRHAPSYVRNRFERLVDEFVLENLSAYERAFFADREGEDGAG